MKSLKQFIVFTMILLIPLIPIYIIEPIHIGTDQTVYSDGVMIYLTCFVSLLYISWMIIANKIAKWIVPDDKE